MKRKNESPEATRARDEQVRRLREMLSMMAPETGASALGADHGLGDSLAPALRRLREKADAA